MTKTESINNMCTLFRKKYKKEPGDTIVRMWEMSYDHIEEMAEIGRKHASKGVEMTRCQATTVFPHDASQPEITAFIKLVLEEGFAAYQRGYREQQRLDVIRSSATPALTGDIPPLSDR